MKPSAEPVFLPAADIARHYHSRAYATLVLEGSYEEAGDQGRFQAAAGDVVLHPSFSAHQNVVGKARTRVLDLPLPFDGRAWPSVARLADVDLVIRTAARDIRECQDHLINSLTANHSRPVDPADQLAAAISANPCLAIGEWTAATGCSREWLSRRFRRLYGIDSAVFRLEARARLAWRRIVGCDEALAQIAVGCGFADQPHMTRAVSRLTGRSPGSWRRAAVTSVQEGRAASR